MAEPTQPTQAAMMIGTAIVSIAAGYMLGMGSSCGFLPTPFSSFPTPSNQHRHGDTSHYDDESESSEEEIDADEILDHAPNWANGAEADKREGLRMSALQKRQGAQRLEEKAERKKTKKATGSREEEERRELQKDWDLTEECKMVLVVRRDLGMGPGKMVAQGAHAAVACYTASKEQNNPALSRWENGGCAKIALQTKSEDEIMELYAMALSLGVVAQTIHDAGRTQIAAGSLTVLGVGPAPKSVVDQITGGLRLMS